MVTISLSWPDRGYFYSLLVVSLLAAKFLHLFSHLPAIPIFLFLLYFPTFVFPDVVVVLLSRVLFQRVPVLGYLLCFVITAASAAQIGFFIETGGEIRWNMMAKVLREPEGFLGMLMTGFAGLAAMTGVLCGIAWLLNPMLYNISFRAVKAIVSTICPARAERCTDGDISSSYALLREDRNVSVESFNYEESLGEEKHEITAIRSRRWARLKLLVVSVVIIVLHVVRPSSPYTHMSGTLPFTLFSGVFTRRSAFCDPTPFDAPKNFPLQETIRPEYWIPPAGEEGGMGRGWMPGTPWWDIHRERPSWLPQERTAGFGKWYRRRHHHHHHGHHPPPPPPSERRDGHHPEGHPPPPPPPKAGPPPPPPGYEPVLDPLKISNLDMPLLQQMQDALKASKIPIKHVVLMSLESTRKDVFPLNKEGVLFKQLTESRQQHPTESVDGGLAIQKRDEQVADLSQLSRNAEIITGEATFGKAANTTHGGLNVAGALTGSTFTLKSLLGSHCGVSPLPVDFLEELESETYQPCLPQILNVMNVQNEDAAGEFAWTNHTWKSVFMQASTNKFDRQQPALDNMGFTETLVREDLMKPDAKYPPKGKELNYFGFSEEELKPYIRDLFTSAQKNGERVFLSHLTSSTHHPWATPEEFGVQQRYWGGNRGGGTPWDRYLNSIRWGDKWIGEFMDLLRETGVADETLVVMIGDHGFSFGDDSSSKTTYANAHINSFRVPLVFHHPALPRLQLNLTTTSMSILPTILDLLQATGSLSPTRATIANDLLPEYEGQSLIRPFLATRDGRQQWNFGVVNPGGTHLSVVSSAAPFRLVLPICEPSPYAFSDLKTDPGEAATVEDWDGGAKLRLKVKTRYGDDAARWVEEAEKVAGWMVWELRRRWDYWGGTRREDRGAGHNDDGLLEHDHWWET